MELIAGRPGEWDDGNAATGEQLNRWIENEWDAIHAIATMMATAPSMDEAHTWADFTPYGGNGGAILEIRKTEPERLQITVRNKEGEPTTELLEVVI